MTTQAHAQLRGLDPNISVTPSKPTRKSLKSPIERDYLLRLAKKVTIDDWDKIIDRAKEQAIEGDYRARDWITNRLKLDSITLLEVVKEELEGRTSDDVVRDFIPPVVT